MQPQLQVDKVVICDGGVLGGAVVEISIIAVVISKTVVGATVG